MFRSLLARAAATSVTYGLAVCAAMAKPLVGVRASEQIDVDNLYANCFGYTPFGMLDDCGAPRLLPAIGVLVIWIIFKKKNAVDPAPKKVDRDSSTFQYYA